jgi:hypothetical protein
VFPVRYGQIYKLSSFKTGQWIMSRIVIVILICHHHKPTDLIYYLMFLSGLILMHRDNFSFTFTILRFKQIGLECMHSSLIC